MIAKKVRKVGTPFKPGDPRINRKGQPKLPDEVKKLRLLTTADFISKFNDLLRKTPIELRRIMDDPRTDILRSYLCSCLIKGKIFGDYTTLNSMLDRLIGKTAIPVSNPDGTNLFKDLKSLSDSEIELRMREIGKRLLRG